MSKKSQQVVFGIHAAESALQNAPKAVTQCYLLRQSKLAKQSKIKALAEKHHISVVLTTKDQLDELSQYQNHQGVLLKCEASEAKIKHEKALPAFIEALTEQPLILILDCVQDPHNFGAILRTADAAGVSAVIVPKDNAVKLTATVAKVACGAAETMAVFEVTNLSRTIKSLQKLGIWIVGMDVEGEKNIYEADLSGPLAVVMGSEGKGIRRLVKEHCDFLVSIPNYGQVQSLNVSVATGVTLFEICRKNTSG